MPPSQTPSGRPFIEVFVDAIVQQNPAMNRDAALAWIEKKEKTVQPSDSIDQFVHSVATGINMVAADVLHDLKQGLGIEAADPVRTALPPDAIEIYKRRQQPPPDPTGGNVDVTG